MVIMIAITIQGGGKLSADNLMAKEF